jgi:hypothetical protein
MFELGTSKKVNKYTNYCAKEICILSAYKLLEYRPSLWITHKENEP